MAKTKTTPKRKPVWQLSRRGVYGSIALALTACAWTFFVGVLVGRGTAPVKFDMEKLGQDLHALREQVQHQQARQLEAYSAAVENKSNMDFYEDLKQPGDDPDRVDDARTRDYDPAVGDDLDPAVVHRPEVFQAAPVGGAAASTISVVRPPVSRAKPICRPGPGRSLTPEAASA